MIDLNSKHSLSDQINYFVDSAIDRQTEEPRDYLGASIIGHICDRHIQYYWRDLKGYKTQKFPARIKRVFDRGNTYEDKARQWLKDAGFIFSPNSHGFIDGEFAGNVDGVITWWQGNEPCPIKLPVLWECKCLKDKSWKEMAKGGLRNYTSTTYWAQVHVYMMFLRLESCLFTSVNADTMELHHELIPFNRAEANLYQSRAHHIIEMTRSNMLVQRHTKDRSHYICKWCDHNGRCWGDE